MAFRADHGIDQIDLLRDSYVNSSERVQRVVRNSWAKVFADEVFPAINGERFSILYKDNEASRPTTPANFTVGALPVDLIKLSTTF